MPLYQVSLSLDDYDDLFVLAQNTEEAVEKAKEAALEALFQGVFLIIEGGGPDEEEECISLKWQPAAEIVKKLGSGKN